MNTRIANPATLACRIGLLLWMLPANAKDVFVTIGGGPDPTHNQISLEKNVQFVSRILEQNYPQPLDHRILFADGKSTDPDLQFIDESVEVTPAIQWMSELLGDPTWATLRYRNHQTWESQQPADKSHVQTLLSQLSQELEPGDRLFVYVTAHGSPAGLEDASNAYSEAEWTAEKITAALDSRNTSLSLWNDEQLSVNEFTDLLDAFDPNVQVTLVMVQCYSGGFADTVFREADRKLGISDRLRCGFFSQRFDRPAAGCTPEINEADYQEYSSYFWAALHARSRDDSEIVDADYNRDGRVTLAEAHAYAIITSDTIDIPVCTSDVLLRNFSRLGKIDHEKLESGGVTIWFGALLGRSEETPDELLTAQTSIAEALKLANPIQQTIINALAEKLEIEPEVNLQDIQRRARRLRRQIDRLDERYDELAQTQSTLVKELRETLHRKAPEFRLDGYSPIITEWTSNHSDAFVALIESLEEAQALQHVNEQLADLDDAVLEKMLLEAKLLRLANTLQSVLLQENLKNVAEAPIVERIEQTIALENSSVWSK